MTMGTDDGRADHGGLVPPDGPWRSSIHMPRWASRISLEVQSIERQHLQDITREEAHAEGFVGVHAFQTTWNALNTKSPNRWTDNPQVWVLRFRVK